MILKNYILNLILLLSNMIIPLVIFPKISQTLGAMELGSVSFSQSFVYYFTILSSFGIHVYGVRELSRIDKREDKQRVFNELFLISIVMMLTALVFYFLVLYIFDDITKKYEFSYLFSIFIILTPFNFDWVFVSFENFKLITAKNLILKFINVSLILIYLSKPNAALKYVIILIILEVLLKFINVVQLVKILGIKLTKINILKHIKPLLIIFISTLAGSLYSHIDKTMLGLYASSEFVGLYTVGTKIILLVIPIITSLGTVLTPMMNYTKNIEEKEVFLKYYELYIKVVGIPISFGMYILADKIIYIIGGSLFDDSIIIMKILAMVIPLIAMSDFIGVQILLVNRQEKKIMLTSIIALFINIILNMLLIPKYSAVGASISTVISEVLVLFLRAYYAKSFYKLEIFNKSTLKYLFLSSSFVFIFKWMQIKRDTQLNVVILFIFGCIIAYIFLLILTKDEFIKYIKKGVKKNE